MASLRQGGSVSFLYSQLTGGVKLSPVMSRNKDATAIWDSGPPNVKVSVLQVSSPTGKQRRRGAISHTNNSRMSQSFTGGQGRVISQWSQKSHPSPRVKCECVCVCVCVCVSVCVRGEGGRFSLSGASHS